MIHFAEPSRPYRGYIFDCDGTLVHSMHLHLEAWNHGLAQDHPDFRIDGPELMQAAGMDLHQSIRHWNRKFGLHLNPEKVIDGKIRYFDAHRGDVVAIEPVVAFARKCLANGAKISVASGGTREDVEFTLRNVGIIDLFHAIITANDVEKTKPHPDLFLKAAETMEVPPEDCLVLEDSELGVEAAKRAGMDVILLPPLI